MPNHIALNRDKFAAWVHDALNHLYDAPYLQRQPLTALFGGEQRKGLQRTHVLRRILLDAVHACKPGPGVPAQSPDWRAYRILELRYLEGQSPAAVMQQVALGKSHYFREQARILDAITNQLWERYHELLANNSSMPALLAEQPNESEESTRQELARVEAERLCAQASWGVVDVGSLLDELHAVVLSLAQVRQVQIEYQKVTALFVARGDRVLLRQALLTLVSHGLEWARGGRLTLAPLYTSDHFGLKLQAQREIQRLDRAADASADHPRPGIGLEVCHYLMAAMGGQLTVAESATGAWAAQLTWPQAPLPTVLVIDDNPTFPTLVTRYLAYDGWRVIGAGSSEDARAFLAGSLPSIILLDIMMPRQDGWELLRALASDVRTKQIPILICSVLNEPELAAMLGAAGYLLKPVTQQALLQALARLHPIGSTLASRRE